MDPVTISILGIFTIIVMIGHTNRQSEFYDWNNGICRFTGDKWVKVAEDIDFEYYESEDVLPYSKYVFYVYEMKKSKRLV